ncbi:MAG: ATP-binding cassette domain-containing protein, partial [Acetatifactor sp.]|nr:ATP-binding cassette domain-containing protein [Acetatifactor sp.]
MSEEKKREKILDVKDLDITFETTAGKVHAIRGINIDLYQGETVAIVGESGSGKSVTMRAAMGILAKNAVVNRGEIIYRYRDNIGGIDYNPDEDANAEWKEADILKMDKDWIRKHINGRRMAMVFQDPMTSLDPTMTI